MHLRDRLRVPREPVTVARAHAFACTKHRRVVTVAIAAAVIGRLLRTFGVVYVGHVFSNASATQVSSPMWGA